MSYAATVKDFSNPVETMLGFVSRKKVQRAIDLGREDARLERVANYQADLEGFASLGKRLAEEASRPKPANASGAAPAPLVPRS